MTSMRIRSSRTPLPAGTTGSADAVARGRHLGRVVAGGLLGFAVVVAVVRIDRRSQIDRAVTLAVQRLRGPFVDRAMTVASWPGFPPQSRVIPVALVGAWLAVGARAEATFQAMAWGSAIVATGIKAVLRRPRPVASEVNVVVAALGGTSFPSGHVLSYVGIYGSLAYLLGTRIRERRLRLALMAPPIALVAAVGPSRIHQGHHWLTDVLASYLLGLSYVAALAWLYRRWLDRPRRQIPEVPGRPRR